MFQDATTHERLNANSKEIFEPGPWYEVKISNRWCASLLSLYNNTDFYLFMQHYIPDLKSGRVKTQDLQPQRVTVNITSPLYSLKDSAMNVILRHVTEEDRICELEIPRQLHRDLLYRKKSTAPETR